MFLNISSGLDVTSFRYIKLKMPHMLRYNIRVKNQPVPDRFLPPINYFPLSLYYCSGANTAPVITKWDHKRLFGDVINVRQCSERFLEDLEKKWQSSILLDGLCEVFRDHAKNHFQVYVKYCSNQVDQGKLLKELR